MAVVELAIEVLDIDSVVPVTMIVAQAVPHLR
jgi:hypothetical protein